MSQSLDSVMNQLPVFEGSHVGSQAEYVELMERLRPELLRRSSLETGLAAEKEQFQLEGHCAVCARPARFWVDRQYAHPLPGGRWPAPNWRERLECEHCLLNNRMRAAIHYLLFFGQPMESESVYVTEQVTPLYRAIAGLLPGTIGSEFAGEAVPRGHVDARGVRNESLSRLTFQDRSFRFLLTFDVLEHIPETEPALVECHRVLQPGGWLIFTVPFDLNSATTLRRASLRPDGTIQHHTEPEFHGDPFTRSGILSYHTFGWELLDRLGRHGFDRRKAFVYWSRSLGYLGGVQVIFSARRR